MLQEVFLLIVKETVIMKPILIVTLNNQLSLIFYLINYAFCKYFIYFIKHTRLSLYTHRATISEKWNTP